MLEKQLKTTPKVKGVYIAILNQGYARVELFSVLLEIVRSGRYNIFLDFPAEKPIAQNRNLTVQRFLKMDNMDYLMFLDNDIIPPKNIMNLVDHDKDIVGGLCFAFMDNRITPLALRRQDPVPEGQKPYKVIDFKGTEGLVEVDAIGTGHMIIARRVLEKITHQPFCNQYDDMGVKTLGLDLSFCYKAKQEGYKVWCHLSYPCAHWTETNLMDFYTALAEKEDSLK